MRRNVTRRVLVLAVAVVALLATAATVAVARVRRIPPPKPPRMTWTQDAKALRLRIENRNEHWGVHHQQVTILYLHESGAPIRLFDPGETHEHPDGGTFVCCLIPSLPPHGVFTFDLPATKSKVYYVDLTLRQGSGWVRM